MIGSDRPLNETNHFEKLANKIDDFQVIILYDRQPNQFDYDYLLHFPSEKLKYKIESTCIFPRSKSETFIVRQQKYEENFDLFFKLRIKARDEMLVRITEFLTAKFYSTNEHHLIPLLENKPTLKWEILNKLFQKYEAMLKLNTRLNDEQSWEGFRKLFKTYLLNHALEEMVQNYGYEHLHSMDKEELNRLFFQKMNSNFATNDNFIDTFTDVVNMYMKKWIPEIVVQFEVEKDPMKQITTMLEASHPVAEHQHIETTVKNNNFTVMSNPIYQFITEALSNRKFIQNEYGEWPRASIQNNTLSGSVQLVPLDNVQAPDNGEDMQELANHITELDIDVLDTLCHLYLTRSSDTSDHVKIRLDDLLHSRGLKTKLGGTGRRGGFEKQQRTQFLKALSIIQSLWIEMDTIVVYKQGKAVKKPIQGRAFLFTSEKGHPYSFTMDQQNDVFLVTIGEAFEHFLKGSGRQVKLQPNQAVEFNPYQRKWEKKLIRYLSWRWRTQARKASYLQPHKISTLLEKLDVQLDSQAPSRIRDRFEKALDLLEEERVISFWQYNNWDESCVEKKGWLRIWQEATVSIAPPDEIITYYQPIERKNTVKNPTNPFLLHGKEEVYNKIGSDFKERRTKLGMTLQQVSNELKISTSYISNIERGVAKPSASVYKRMRDWLDNMG
ncbi:helix-turn-helix transcriptional regulator [Sporosarcina sp. GW1-11]|uniref:helix-turn-helix domain-containing protein n=1 Tax=Sporosarcina sp. GW1-11 TaxID=2899126 RepID=UPI00294D3F2E|nr:helix-turn-helix transcriptional regulator [Sporosarcina sp. GW1-11]MDV6377094.1 helix-turn-helix transcriptional regulator [Sporosarcina sp. GW1-11]